MPKTFVKMSWQEPYDIFVSSAASLNSQSAVGVDDDMGNIFVVFGS
jgi:hypothetical protein